METEGKVAVVTGGARRIGRALILGLAKAGYNVCIHYNRSESDAYKLANEVQDCGVRATVVQADLSRIDDVMQVIPTAAASLGRVDLLVNSASIFDSDDQFRNVTTPLWEQVVNVNLRAPFFLCQSFARHQIGAIRRNIVNISDARAARPGIDHTVYRMTKSALSELTKSLALDLAPDVAVNCISLGAILPPVGKDERYLHQRAVKQIPLRQSGSVDNVVDALLYLVRQDFVTGASIAVDGGEFL